MPASILCDLCGDETAASLVTDLGTGDSIAVGHACQVTFHLTVATELLAGMPAGLAAEYVPLTARLNGALELAAGAHDMAPEPAAAPDPDTGPAPEIAPEVTPDERAQPTSGIPAARPPRRARPGSDPDRR